MAPPAPRRSPSSPTPFSRSRSAAAELWGRLRQHPDRRSAASTRVDQLARALARAGSQRAGLAMAPWRWPHRRRDGRRRRRLHFRVRDRPLPSCGVAFANTPFAAALRLPALTNLLVLSRARGRSEQGWRWPPGDGPTGAAAVAVVADSIFAFAIGRCRAVGSPSPTPRSPQP